MARATDDQFSQLTGRIRGRGNDVSGELVVTSLGGLSHMLVPVLADFQIEYPDIVVRFLTGDRIFRLEIWRGACRDPRWQPARAAR